LTHINANLSWRKKNYHKIDGKFVPKEGALPSPPDMAKEQEREYWDLVAKNAEILRNPMRDLPCGDHKCPKCPLQFQVPKNAENHALTHHARPKRKREEVLAGEAETSETQTGPAWPKKVFAIPSTSGSGKKYMCPVKGCGKQFTTKDVTKHMFVNINAGGHAEHHLELDVDGLWIDRGPKNSSAASPQLIMGSAIVVA
jgi:hypothetical protein